MKKKMEKENFFEKKKMSAEVVLPNFSEDVMGRIIAEAAEVERKSFPKGWQFPNIEEYLRESFSEEKNICIVLKENEKVVGYLVMVSLEGAIEELKGADPGMPDIKEGYCLDTISILPEKRSGYGFLKMLRAMKNELKKRKTKRLMMHARLKNNLSKAMKSFFGREGRVVSSRVIEKWKCYNYQEPTEYLDIKLGE